MVDQARCVEIELRDEGRVERGPERSWDRVLDHAAAIRLVQGVDVPGFTAYEVVQAEMYGGGTRQFLVADSDVHGELVEVDA